MPQVYFFKRKEYCGGRAELVEDFVRTDKFMAMEDAFSKVEHSFELFFNSEFFPESLGVKDV